MNKIHQRAFVLLVTLVISLSAYADWRFGVHANYENTGAIVTMGGDKFGTSNISGFSIGPVVAYEFIDYFSLQTGIDFLMNGFATEDKSLIKNVPYVIEDVMRLFYLQVPIYAVGQLPLRNDVTLLLEAGPHFSCGVGDEITSTLHLPSVQPIEESVKNQAFDNVLSRFNASMHVALGAEYMGARLMVGYNFGLYNLSLLQGTKIHSGGFVLSVGYMF